MDDSDVTLNVCLGKQFSGGELFFRGVRCENHVNTETQPEVSSKFYCNFLIIPLKNPSQLLLELNFMCTLA